MKIRVFLADDSVFFRQLLIHILSKDPMIEVVGDFPNGRKLLEKIPEGRPDIILLDVEMAEMGGLETLKVLRSEYPSIPTIMFSAFTQKGASATIEALFWGARDYATKPRQVRDFEDAKKHIEGELLPKIRGLASLKSSYPLKETSFVQEDSSKEWKKNFLHKSLAPLEALAIGASTGGPPALFEVLSYLPKDFPLPVLIVQHMPPLFTTQFAKRLNDRLEISVQEASLGDILESGKVYIAPGNLHMEIEKAGTFAKIVLGEGPKVNSCRPSVDVLFGSLAREKIPSLAVVLTGMGEDGQQGCRELKQQGCPILVQSEETSLVWGMPGAVVQAGLADKVLPLRTIGEEILSIMGSGTGGLTGKWAN